jgi:hypothetical protein
MASVLLAHCYPAGSRNGVWQAAAAAAATRRLTPQAIKQHLQLVHCPVLMQQLLGEMWVVVVQQLLSCHGCQSGCEVL